MPGRVFSIPWRVGSLLYDERDQSVRYVEGGARRRPDLASDVVNVGAQVAPQDLEGSLGQGEAEASPPGFAPVCLTVHPHEQCNLACGYCYAASGAGSHRIDVSAIVHLARMVARNCVALGRPFALGFHGACEPLLDLPLVVDCAGAVREVCREAGLRMLLHVTTSGVIPEETARAAARLFDSVSLSCDGPAMVHDSVRRTRAGGATLEAVERAGRILLAGMARPWNFRVRATVTAEGALRMEEIGGYFAERWPGLRHLQIEPVFQRGRSRSTVPPLRFAAGYLALRNRLARAGMKVAYAGTRPETHGRFCPILQDNLTVTADGHLTACFCVAGRRSDADDPFLYGSWRASEAAWTIDEERLRRLQGRTRASTVRCHACFLRRRCAQGCPDVCPLSPDHARRARDYDCRAQRWIGAASLAERAGVGLTDSEIAGLESAPQP